MTNQTIERNHPEAIFIQLHTYCNASCLNCPHDFTYKTHHPSGKMSQTTWEKILIDLINMNYKGQIGFYLHHEPLIDKNLFEKINDINKKTNAYVVLSTNGALLTENSIKKLLEFRPRKVHININSGNKTEYENSMGLYFEETIHNTKNFISQAKNLIDIEINCPVIEGYDVQKLKEIFSDVKVNLEFSANSRGGLLPEFKLKEKASRFKIDNYCKQPSQNFNILYDGSVLLCCMDWMHETKKDFMNIHDSNILNIYKEAKKLEDNFKRGDYSQYKMCENCSDEMGFTKITSRSLNILITNHHLLDFTGSEIFTLTLADSLTRKGHNVIVYSKYVDKMLGEFNKRNIKVVEDLNSIKNYKFDIAHVHHSINAMEVRYYFPSLPIVFLSHGVLPFLEQPPFIELNIQKYLAVSEEVKENLINKGIKENQIEIFRNIVDTGIFNERKNANHTPKKALILSNRIDRQTQSIIQEACIQLNIELKTVGQNFGLVDQEMLPEIINEVDLVFSLGRGAMETMLCGRVPIIFDYMGGDGIVTSENYEEVKKHNFSGRRFSKKFSVEELIQEIKKYDYKDIKRIHNLALKDFSADINVERLLNIYFLVLNTEVPILLSENERSSLTNVISMINETNNYSIEKTKRNIRYEIKNYLNDRDKSRNDFTPAVNLKRQLTKSSELDLNIDIFVSIIIPVFNKLEFTRKCIETLYEVTSIDNNFEVIVVDNGSSDGTKEFLDFAITKYPNFRFIENKNNLGYAKANNQAAEISKGEFLVFLNNDTEPLNGWLESGINKLKSDDNIGIVGAKLLYPDRTIQHCGITFIGTNNSKMPIWPVHRLRGVDEKYKGVQEEKELLAVTGACLFIKKELFVELNGFDKEYGMYFEDIDLCFKVKKLSKKILYEPNCVLIHHEGKSGISQNEIDKLNLRAAEIFFSKWHNEINIVLENNLQKDILWLAPFFNPSGYASEAISFALGLEKLVNLTIRHHNNFLSQDFIKNIPVKWKDILFKLHKIAPQDWRTPIPITKNTIVVHHRPGESLIKSQHVAFTIGRTMFETNSVPTNWIDKCNAMDEIWVPSKFNYETFKKAGVDERKLHIIHESIDVEIFDPNKVKPLVLPNKKSFNFLSIFEWTNRKGWDVLLKAYFSAFTSEDDVCLYLRTYLLGNYDSDTKLIIQNKINKLIQENNYQIEKLPKYEILSEQLPFDQMLSLYKAADAFVLPSRGEGWGRPYMEAMAMQLPVIGTNWSGNTEFMNENNSYLISVDKLVEIKENEITSYLGHKWAEPSLQKLKELMLYVFNNKDEAAKKGIAARKDIVEKFNLYSVAEQVVNRLEEIEQDLSYKKIKSKGIAWEGAQFRNESLALINREFSARLIAENYNLSILPTLDDEYSPDKKSKLNKNKKYYNKRIDNPALTIRHQWPPNLAAPESGHWIMIQPWEFGSMPKEWAEVFSSQVDEIWVPSNYVRQIYIDGGVEKNRIQVIPNGIDETIFNPKAKKYKLKTKKKFKFLFVGGTIYRKGIDILLESYLSTFKNTDDVCLVIKDMGGNSFYKGQTFKDQIQKIVKNKDLPEIEYINKTLTEKEIAGLYKVCDVLVHPYRGEGFGLPILESMACGTPAIVPNDGACLDFCSEQNSIFIKAEKKYFDAKKVDNLETVNYPWLLEPDIQDIKEKLLYAYNNKEELVKKGEIASEFVIANFTWDNVFEILQKRINAIYEKTILRFNKKTDKEGNDLNKLLEIALENITENKLNYAYTNIKHVIDNYHVENVKTNLDELNNLAGKICLSQDNFETARIHFERALTINPNSPLACEGLAEIFYLEGLYKSKTMYEWAVKNDPQNQQATEKLQNVNSLLGIDLNHNSLFENVQQEDNFSDEIQNMLAQLLNSIYKLYENKQFDAALTALNQNENLFYSQKENENAIEIIPAFENLKGFVLLELNELDFAKESFEKALQLNPESSQACAGLAEIFYQNEMFDESKTMFEWAVKNNPENQFAINGLSKVNAELNLQTDHNNLISQDPNLQNEFNISENLNLILQYYSEKKYEEVVNRINEIEEILNENIDAEIFSSIYNLKGFSFIALEDLENAQSSFEKALELDPNSAEACSGLGEVFYLADMINESKTMFEWSLKNDPEYTFGVTGLKKVNSELGLEEFHSNLN